MMDQMNEIDLDNSATLFNENYNTASDFVFRYNFSLIWNGSEPRLKMKVNVYLPRSERSLPRGNQK